MRALSRKKAPRQSLLRNLVTSLVLYERIKTTTSKAKEAKPIIEHLIAIAKKNDLNARRSLLKYLFDKNAVKKMLEVLVPRYAKIDSGFTRTYKLGYRAGDGAEITILELIKPQEQIEVVKTPKEENGIKASQTKTFRKEKSGK